MYLAKSAGYDDARAWDREDALFAEARADVQKLKGLSITLIEPEAGVDGVAASDHGDEVLDPDRDEDQQTVQTPAANDEVVEEEA